MIEFLAEWGIPRSVEHALEQARATKEIGGRYAKWQLFDPKRLASKHARRYWSKDLGGPERQLANFRGAGDLSDGDWHQVVGGCREIGVEPLVTPFDLEAVELLEDLGVSAYKIASGDITYKRLIQKVGKTGKRVFLSTGAADKAETRKALGWLSDSEVVLFACDLVYPCAAAESSIAQQLPALAEFARTTGYSDHTREVMTGAVAVTLGATVLEKHLTLDRNGDSPDDKMALTVDQAKIYYHAAEQAGTLCSVVSGDPQAAARVGARRSAYALRSLEAGHVLRSPDIAWLRPCPAGAIDPSSRLAGRTLVGAVAAGERIERGNLG